MAERFVTFGLEEDLPDTKDACELLWASRLTPIRLVGSQRFGEPSIRRGPIVERIERLPVRSSRHARVPRIAAMRASHRAHV